MLSYGRTASGRILTGTIIKATKTESTPGFPFAVALGGSNMNEGSVRILGIARPGDFDFDSGSHNEVSVFLQPFQSLQEAKWRYFTAGWNGVAHRFLSTAEHDEAYRRTFADGLKTHEDLYQMDRDLFDFFTNGLAVIECVCFSVYILGSIVNSGRFPIRPDSALRDNVYPKRVVQLLKRDFPNEEITGMLARTVDSGPFREWKDVRDALSHRASPARTFYENVGGPPRTNVEVGWVAPGINLTLKVDTSATRREWLAIALSGLMKATVGFCARLPRPS